MDLLDKLLAGYNLKVLQSVVQIDEEFKKNGLSISLVKQYLKSRNNQQKLHWLCPICGKPLAALEVNTHSKNIVGESWKTLFYCFDWKNCGYERYSEKTIQEELELLRRKNNGTR